jgi:hypothetical protein
MVSVELMHKSYEPIKIIYEISAAAVIGKYLGGYHTAIFDFQPKGGTSLYIYRFESRAKIMKSLVDGTLVIMVAMKLANPTKVKPPPFIPENPSACKLIQSMFMDEESSDIVFEVEGQHVKDNAEKVARTAPVAFHAHRFILRKCSSWFDDLGEGMVPIPINYVSPDIFRILLNYIYGGRVLDDNMREHGKEIIDAADHFNVTNLKLEAEAHFVQATSFCLENFMEHLIYAEKKTCALLKEAVVDFIVENKDEVLKKTSFNGFIAPETVIRDVLAAIGKVEKNSGGISELRRKAHERGLDVDGSREALIAALAGSP